MVQIETSTTSATLGSEPEKSPFRSTSNDASKPVTSDPTFQASVFQRPHIDLFNGTSPFKTIAEVIEFHSVHNAKHDFCIQAERRTGAGAEGFDLLPITYRALKQGILRCSEWFLGSVPELVLPTANGDGKKTKGPPIALLMESDIGLLTHQLALISLGIPVLLLSARLNAHAVHHLMHKTRARAIISSDRLKKVAKDAVSLAKEPPALYLRQNYSIFYDGETRPCLDKSSICGPDHYIGDDDCNVLILHSSGTTGLPKPIFTSHKHLLCYMLCHEMENPTEAEGVNVTTLPLYHGFGLLAPLLSLGIGKTLCIPPPSIIPTGKFTLELVKTAGARTLMSVPSILEDISLLPDAEGSAVLAGLDFVAFGGGGLKPTVGDKLSAAGVKILNHYGTTETGGLAPAFIPDADYDWRYFRLRSDLPFDISVREQTDDGPQRYKLTANPFGWGRTFEIQDDLLLRHPAFPRDFTTAGRNDDWIVLSTGEKVLPGVLESKLTNQENVKAAVMFGEGQFEPGVLVQPNASVNPDELNKFVDAIWPIIKETNARMDAHARISGKSAVVVLSTETVIPRSDKGSVLRKEVYKVFDGEIREAYRKLEDEGSEDQEEIDMGNLEAQIKDIIQVKLEWAVPANEWSADDDLFELGMDSLQALRLRRALLASLPAKDGIAKQDFINRHFVYENPSVNRLATAIRRHGSGSTGKPSKEVEMRDLADTFAVNGGPPFTETNAVILMTGSTGSLGSYILTHMASLPTVSRVICLNRKPRKAQQEMDLKERQRKSLAGKGVELSDECWSKIELLATDTSKPNLGLSDTQYEDIASQVTHVLHTAWPMDFRMQLLSFRGQFQTLQNLLALARKAFSHQRPNRIRFVFASSIAAVGQYPSVEGNRVVPETPMPNERVTNAVGYGEAKLVCERIMERAADEYATELDAAYVRIGQMSGSSINGYWNAEEHLAALLRSAQTIGKLPILKGTMSWIPVDHAAAVMSDITLDRSSCSLVYHMENPIRQSWFDAMQVMASKLNIPSTDFVPFTEWLDKVRQLPDTDHNPAQTLLDFFEHDFPRMSSGQIILGTDTTRKVSPTLRNLDLVSEDIIASYVDNWKKIGHLV